MLARQGLTLRGHDEQNSNFFQFLQCRADDIPELKEWLQRSSGNKWIHHDIVDEILKTMTNEVLFKKKYQISRKQNFTQSLQMIRPTYLVKSNARFRLEL